MQKIMVPSGLTCVLNLVFCAAFFLLISAASSLVMGIRLMGAFAAAFPVQNGKIFQIKATNPLKSIGYFLQRPLTCQSLQSRPW